MTGWGGFLQPEANYSNQFSLRTRPWQPLPRRQVS